MPEGFAWLSLWKCDKSLGLWSLVPLRRGECGGGSYWLGAIARLKPGVSSGQLTEELAAARQIVAADPTRDPYKTL
ncbi:MAG TPA: hypothetical protein VK178_01055 [Opitutaceae bacterium]|nr:hypothetical protein [Opitutaceae bacterium]